MTPRRRLLVGAAAALAALSLSCGAPARGTIGAVLGRKPDGRVYVREVPNHLAAAEAGIEVGDELLLIEGQDVRLLDDEELQRALGGLLDEPVALTFVRGDKVVRVTVRRSLAQAYRLE